MEIMIWSGPFATSWDLAFGSPFATSLVLVFGFDFLALERALALGVSLWPRFMFCYPCKQQVYGQTACPAAQLPR